MFSLNKVSVQFNGIFIFSDISFLVNRGSRVGLTGKNGAGKSTLLKIIAGEITPESGDISLPKDYTLGYLPQELRCKHDQSVFQEAMEAFSVINDMEKEAEALNTKISERDDYESDSYSQLISRLSEINDKLQILGGYTREADTEKVLIGLGFLREELHKPARSFSGGWRMRLELAKILLKKPDILLLDEPTNHLDIEAIQWLEGFLSNFQGAIVMVSHDRAFLDSITNRTIEINAGRIFDYPVPYSEYVGMQQERLQMQLAALNNQQREIQHIQQFIERFRYKSTKAKQVQSRIKLLDKMEMVEIDETDNSSVFFRFPPAPASGKIALEAVSLGKKYDTKSVLENIDFIVDAGDKVAFVGRNGEGKTTLSRIIVGELEHSGVFKLGHNIKIGYFAQNQDELLDGEKTVFQTIDDVAVGDVRKRIRGILGSFLFGEEDIDKKVKVLSGGEKSRIALAKLLLEPVNLLVLDEPTNHLDMSSKDILKSALLKYDGTLVLVSHDRDFLQGLTNKVFEFKNKGIRQHFGDIYDFLESRRIENLNALNMQSGKKTSSVKYSSEATSKQSYNERKELDREARKIRTSIEKLEQKIASLEKRKEEINLLLANPDNAVDGVFDGSLYRDFENCEKQIEEMMEQWDALLNEESVLQEKRQILKP